MHWHSWFIFKNTFFGSGIHSFIQSYMDCKMATHFSLEQILSPPTSIPFWGQRVFWYSKYISQAPQGSGNARFVTLWAARAVWKVCWGRLLGDAGWRQAVIPLVGRWKGRLTPSQPMIDVLSLAPLATCIFKWKCRTEVGSSRKFRAGERVVLEKWELCWNKMNSHAVRHVNIDTEMDYDFWPLLLRSQTSRLCHTILT